MVPTIKQAPEGTCSTQLWVLDEHALRVGEVMGWLLPECSVLTHSLRCLNLTFRSWADSGQILLEVKSIQSSWKGEKLLRSVMTKLMRWLMKWIAATVQVSKIACKWFIPMMAKPIDNGRVLIKYQPLGKYSDYLLALCLEYCTFKQRPNYFPIIVPFRLNFYVLPFLFSFSSISHMFDLKPKRRWGKK